FYLSRAQSDLPEACARPHRPRATVAEIRRSAIYHRGTRRSPPVLTADCPERRLIARRGKDEGGPKPNSIVSRALDSARAGGHDDIAEACNPMQIAASVQVWRGVQHRDHGTVIRFQSGGKCSSCSIPIKVVVIWQVSCPSLTKTGVKNMLAPPK